MTDIERMFIMFFPEEDIKNPDTGKYKIGTTTIYTNDKYLYGIYYDTDHETRNSEYGKDLLSLCKQLPKLTTITTRRELQ